MTIDERLEALTMNLELQAHETENLRGIVFKHSEQLAIDAEHIRALVRIAEIHEHRLTSGNL
jgi:DUF971 family protein